MNTQPEALRLADLLDGPHSLSSEIKAAAELRRLHEVNQMLVESAEMALEAFEMYLQHSTKEMIFNQIATARAKALRQALAKAKEQA